MQIRFRPRITIPALLALCMLLTVDVSAQVADAEPSTLATKNVAWVAVLFVVVLALVLWRLKVLVERIVDYQRWLVESEKRTEALRVAFDDQRHVLREKMSAHADLAVRYEVLKKKYDKHYKMDDGA